MKKLMIGTTLALMLVFLAGCATQATKASTKVKCPACGYDFTIPNTPGN